MSTIECNFSYADLVSPGDYSALSYTWGKDLPSIPIMLGGITTLVTSNLYLALLHFRERGIQMLWVDYLCINQADLTERANQVSLMKDVYRNANTVLIWLGESNALTARAFEEFNDLLRLLDYDDAIPVGYMKTSVVKHPERWRAISEMLYRPWFRRMWIIQEVLSARHCLMVCGKDILELNVFLRVINSCFRADTLRAIFSYHPNRHEMYDGPMGVAIQQITFLVKTKFSTLNFLMLAQFEPTLLNYLAETRWAEATDPRDKVYGILSLAQFDRTLGHWQDEGEDSRWIPFIVSYAEPESKVFISVAKAIISSSRSLDILRFTKYPTRQAEDYPSWVPNWADPKPHPVDSHLSLTNIYKTHSNASWRPYRSDPIHDDITHHCMPYYRFQGENILTIKGIHYDTIVSCSPDAHPYNRSIYTDDPLNPNVRESIYQTQQYTEKLNEWIQDCVQQALKWCSPYPSTQTTTWGALWTLLNGKLGDTNAYTPGGPEEMLEDFAEARKSFAKVVPHMLAEALESQHPLLYVAANVGTHYYGTCLSRLPKSSVECRGKKFAATKSKFMGLVPEQTVVGDLVCFVYGMEMPLILRESDHGQFRCIGNGQFQGLSFDDAVVEEIFVDSGKRTRKKVEGATFRTFRLDEPSVYTVLQKTRFFDLV
jgi:hypothetical protein